MGTSGNSKNQFVDFSPPWSQMESQAKQLRSSAEMTESVLHTNSQLQEKGQALQK